MTDYKITILEQDEEKVKEIKANLERVCIKEAKEVEEGSKTLFFTTLNKMFKQAHKINPRLPDGFNVIFEWKWQADKELEISIFVQGLTQTEELKLDDKTASGIQKYVKGFKLMLHEARKHNLLTPDGRLNLINNSVKKLHYWGNLKIERVSQEEQIVRVLEVL